MNNVIKVSDLKKSFRTGFLLKPQTVLKGLSFNVKAGRITGFLGTNGSGKTTTLKCILGLAFADSGEVSFFDGKPLSGEIKKRIGFLPERPYFYEYLTGREFLQFYGQLAGLRKSVIKERSERLLKKVNLEHAQDKRLRDYSKGMLQKVGVAQALIHDPEFVILDEPMTGLDPDGRYHLGEIIRETARSGKSVFFSSHLLHDTEKLCQDLIILKNGHTAYQGTTSEFLDKTGVSVQLHYEAQGERQQMQLPDMDQAQVELERLRKSGARIIELKQQRMDLEEAFMKLSSSPGDTP